MRKDLTEDEKKVFQLINSLTNDEDHKQDLWVHYLSGDNASFTQKLEQIASNQEQERKLRSLVYELINSHSPKAKKIVKIIDSLTELERSILACFLIDLDLQQISKAKNISLIRINQVVTTIRYNSRWRELDGTEEKFHSGRKARPDPGRDQPGREVSSEE